jgi:hypothetical protein
LVGKPEKKRSLGILTRKTDNNIKTDPKEGWFEDVDCVYLGQGWIQ